jgi:hypothetical protein
MSTTRRYVVQKIAGDFVAVRQESDPVLSALLSTGGLWSASWGARTRGWVGLGAVALGACMVYRGITGQSLVDRLLCGRTLLSRNERPGDSPSFPESEASGSTQAPMDDVDEASMESFPASDPPARHSSTGS